MDHMSKRHPTSVKVYMENLDFFAIDLGVAQMIKISRNELHPMLGVYVKLIEYYE